MKSQKMAQLTVLALLVFAGSLTLGDTQVQANEGSDATHPAKGTGIWSWKKPKMF